MEIINNNKRPNCQRLNIEESSLNNNHNILMTNLMASYEKSKEKEKQLFSYLTETEWNCESNKEQKKNTSILEDP